MITIPVRFTAAAFLAAVHLGAQTLYIPQIADGGGWQTTLVLSNTNDSASPVTLNFYQQMAFRGELLLTCIPRRGSVIW
jgi:hypothetical protein